MFNITPIKGKENAFKITGELTKGKLISIRNALAHHPTSLAAELAKALDLAAEKAKIHLQ